MGGTSRRYTLALLLAFLAVLPLSGQPGRAEEQRIVIENPLFRLVLSHDGYAASLWSKAAEEECLVPDARVPFCSVKQYRPYDNENFLMYPAKPRSFPSRSIRYENGKLYVEFDGTYDIAVISVKVAETYIAFNLERIDYRIESIGVKRRTEIDELAIAVLPVKNRGHFGEWLNVLWNNSSAVCLMGTSPECRIDTFRNGDCMEMYAGCEAETGFDNVGAALIVNAPDSLLDCIAQVEKDFGLPKGVESRRRPEYRFSYYELRDVTKDNIDRHIAYAKQGGFRTIVIYYPDFAYTCGHFLWNSRFPGGIEDLKYITSRIKEAGLIPGFHIHYSKVSVDDPYVCGGVPDPRLNTVRTVILSSGVSADDNEILIDGNTNGMSLEDGRRIMRIENELITYRECVPGHPSRLAGCERGVLGTLASAHFSGTSASLMDVDTWPRFIRVDQNTGIQDEIAECIGGIYSEAGFRFVYFDGAEDVPMPYWYNVSKSQMSVYQKLEPEPLFSEGALKSHFGWHILTRGNAFDLFRPEHLREAMRKYTLPCAARISDDFTAVNFGWTDYLAPDSLSIGMQPDMYEFVCSKAAGWDCPFSLMGKLDQIDSNPRTEDNMEVIRRWEDAKLSGALDDVMKDCLKNPDAEYFMLGEPGRGMEVLPYCSITGYDERRVRAFFFERGGKNCILYWSPCETESEPLYFNSEGHRTRLYDTSFKSSGLERRGRYAVLPLGGRMVLETDMDKEQLIKEFRRSAGL